jgi:subtilisin family serine protease
MVAGIISGNSTTLTGVAPNVILGAYKVFSCDKKKSEKTSTEVLLRAMERAMIDEMDVINMSIGCGSAWPQYLESKVASILAKNGITVVAAQGTIAAWTHFRERG